jgi:TfoX/Sxy family transcriptional regulator of competence genes
VYDEKLANRIERIVSSWKPVEIRKIFGGIGYLYNGNMFSGVYKDLLILRLSQQSGKEALDILYVQPFDITGRPMKGWVTVSTEGTKTDEQLETWLNKAKEFTQTLPPKKESRAS